MMVTSLVAIVAPRTSKIVKNGLRAFERGENLLQKEEKICYKIVSYTLCLDSVSRQKSRWKVRI